MLVCMELDCEDVLMLVGIELLLDWVETLGTVLLLDWYDELDCVLVLDWMELDWVEVLELVMELLLGCDELDCIEVLVLV